MSKLLTKSAYIAGLGSKAYLWRYVNDKTSIFTDDSSKSRMDEGTEVGEYAKRLFSGIDLKDYQFIQNIEKAKELCNNNILFEAGFKYNRCYVRLDVLIPVDGGFEIIEVKSAARVKEIYLEDLKFQMFVLSSLGMNVKKCSILHINPNYVKQGAIEVDKLFSLVDCTDQVNSILDITQRVNDMINVIDLPECPEYMIDDLLSGYDDPLADEFIGDLPSGNVFDLYKLGKEKAVSLYKSDIKLISQIPDNYSLSDKQKIQKLALDNVYVDKKNISKFLSSLKYPIIHMDFEAFSSAIPIFDNTKPHQHIPFQYSLHIQHEDRVEHKEFLYLESGDPREDFIKNLINDIPSEGTILSFYKNYEVGRLDDIAKLFPQYSDNIELIKRRMDDLIIPFRNFYFYDSRQEGSCSIKAILPIFSSNNHSTLQINNGQQAMLEYKNNRGNISLELKKELLDYCSMDTEGMVVIVEGLKKLVNDESINSEEKMIKS
jgi:hypothetical protein